MRNEASGELKRWTGIQDNFTVIRVIVEIKRLMIGNKTATYFFQPQELDCDKTNNNNENLSLSFKKLPVGR